jgi:hypothetical protein
MIFGKMGRGKKGQFYLMAAIVIISIVLGTFYVRNYVYVGKVDTRISDIKDILERESLEVIDSGVEDSSLDIEDLLNRFMTEFGKELRDDANFYLLYGTMDSDGTTMNFDVYYCKNTAEGIIRISGGADVFIHNIDCSKTSIPSGVNIYDVESIVIKEEALGDGITYPIGPGPGEAKNVWIFVKEKVT